jgi:hypothetical protein
MFELTHQLRTAVVAAVAYTVLYVQGMNKAILVALPQQLNSLVISKLTGHTMLDSPAAYVARMDARFQDMVTVFARGSKPGAEATRTGRHTPVSGLLDSLTKILGRKDIIRQCRQGSPNGGKGESHLAQPLLAPIIDDPV